MTDHSRFIGKMSDLTITPGPRVREPRVDTRNLHLKRAREKTGLTQQKVAERADLSRSQVWRIEQNEDARISAVLGYVEAIGGRLLADLPDGRTEPLTAVDGCNANHQRSKADTVRRMKDLLGSLSGERIAEILGTSPRTLTRWKGDEHPANRRAAVATELTSILTQSWTEEGVYRWFSRPHPELSNATPISLLNTGEPVHDQRLLAAALGGRDQRAT